MESRATAVNPARIAELGDDAEVFLLDVRRERDYEAWHIDGAYNVPLYDQLLRKDYGGLEAALDEIPSNVPVYVVCVAGITSARAAAFLRDRGYDAASMVGGMRGWGRVHRSYDVEGADGVIQVVRPGTGCLSYLVYDDREAVVVDPSQYVQEYIDVARERELEIIGVIDTHAHADHVSGGRTLAAELAVPYFLHEADGGHLDWYVSVRDGDRIAVGDRFFEVVHTPGHTPGSTSLRFGGVLLSGDTLFIRSVGRPDLEDDDDAAVRQAAGQLFTSLREIADLPDETVVLPGHFSNETARPLVTTLGELRTTNELLVIDSEEAFVERVVESLGETPANYRRIKRVNWGLEPLSEETAQLELGPNNCAAT
ncbi:MBL fold metallo-hydrolase [Halalkalicoccus salilacus]|uniref:MBL fold metallo-hydrolase n=1 Tax=Halalkalicoccus salilacus TaxID=3117459 RepID=UPI00300EB604